MAARAYRRRVKGSVARIDYELYGRIMELVQLDPYFDRRTSRSYRNSMYYAVKHGKCLTHYVNGELVGFCLWGFFTEQEIKTNTWDGDEAFARERGEALYVSQFQCRAGAREVVKFVRKIQEELTARCPGVETAAAHRLYSSGNKRNARWYRKSP